MAEEAANFDISRILNMQGSVIADRLLQGVTDGTNFPLYLLPLITQISGLDEDDNRGGLAFWEDSLEEVLTQSPQDLTEEDIGTLRTKITDYISNAETPEQLENAARFYMHSNYGENYAVPDNTSAFAQYRVATIQDLLSRMTTPGESDLNNNTYPILGMNAQLFEPTWPEIHDTSNPEFISALSRAIEQIQTDMRRAEVDFASLEDTPLAEMENVGLDRAGYMGEQSDLYLERFQTFLAENETFTKFDVRERIGDLQTIFDLIDDLPQDEQDQIDAALLEASREPPGIETPPDPNAAPTPAPTPPSPEEIAANDLIQRTGNLMGIPQNVMDSIEVPFILEALPGAHFHEGFRREMRDLFQEDMIEVYGIQNPNSDDVYDRIRQAPGELFRSWFDANNTPYEFVEQPDGTDILMRVNPDGSLQALPEGQAPTELFEYHIQPDGTIDRYLMGENGQLLDEYLDGTPIMLDGQYPNFDIEHINHVTHRFLQKYNDASWEYAIGDAGLDQYFETRPSASQLDIQITATKADFREGVLDYFRGVDDENTDEINEASDERAQDTLKQAVREHYENIGQPLDEEELDELTGAVLAGNVSQSVLDGILNAQSSIEDRASTELNMFLLQIMAMQSQMDRTTLLDFANVHNSGLLPGGLQGRQLGITEAWRQGRPNLVEGGQYQWERSTEYRTFDPLVYDAIVESNRNGGELTMNAFQNDEQAMAIIEQLGWQDNTSFSVAETGIIAQKLMISEALDRHNQENPGNLVTDINSSEARAIFIEDFRNGEYNWHDIEIFMGGFDADQVAMQESRARFLAGTDESMHADYAANPDFWYQADDMRRRSQQFNEAFGTDTTLALPNGSTIDVNNATISQDDAVMLFWRNHDSRESFGYEKAQYDINYDEMMDLLILQDPSGASAQRFANEVKDVMENTSLYQQFQTRSVNPEGDMEVLYIRRYEAAMEARRETDFKREHDVVPDAQPSVVNGAALDPEVDRIVPLPPPRENTAAPPAFRTAEPPSARPTAEELNDNCSDITAPSEEVLALCGGGPAVTPTVTPQQLPGMAN